MGQFNRLTFIFFVDSHFNVYHLEILPMTKDNECYSFRSKSEAIYIFKKNSEMGLKASFMDILRFKANGNQQGGSYR